MIHLTVVVLIIALASVAKMDDAGPTLHTFEATVRFADGRADKVRAQARDFNEARNAIESVHCASRPTPSCIVEDLRTVPN